MLSGSCPSSEGTSSVVPSAASGKLIGTSMNVSSPSRRKSGCAATLEIHVEIARGTAANAGLAIAADANARTVVDAGRDAHGEFALDFVTSAPAADRARLRDHVTFTAARRAGRLRDELPEGSLPDGAHDAAAVTALASDDQRSGRAPEPLHVSHCERCEN